MNALVVAAALTVWSVVCFFAGYGLAAWRETWAPARRRGGYFDITRASVSTDFPRQADPALVAIMGKGRPPRRTRR